MNKGIWVASVSLIIAAAAATEAVAQAPPVQTCTAWNIPGFPYSGTLCGGAYTDGCTPGAIYQCTGGPRFMTNNCTLSTACAVGCLTGNSTPITFNVPNPQANDACYNGAAPFTLSPGSLVGGDDVTLTATLTEPQLSSAIVNFNGLGSVVAQPCNVPLILPDSANSLSISLPTALVASTTQVPLWTLISFVDVSSLIRSLVSVPTTLTLEPGGSVVVPPLASFTLTDPVGVPISTIPGGANSFTYGTLASPAPFGGLRVAVTTSPAGAFTTDASFTINAACITNSSPGLLKATTAATSDIAATVTAINDAGTPISLNVTVTPPPLKIQSVTLAPMSVTAGATSTATVTLNRAVNGNDPTATVSIRVSEGLLSGTQLATFPGCTGSPVCIGPATVAIGASSTTVTLSTFAVGSQDQVTVSASAPWSNESASRNLTINPDSTAPPPPPPPPPAPSAPSLLSPASQATVAQPITFDWTDTANAATYLIQIDNSQTFTTPLTLSQTVSVSQATIAGLPAQQLWWRVRGINSAGVAGPFSASRRFTVRSAPAAASLSSVSLNPTSVVGGNTSQGMVTLTSAAPTGGAVVSLGSSSASATVPASVIVAAGATSAGFTVTTSTVTTSTTATLTATYNAVSRTAALTITLQPPPASLASVAVNPTSVVGGQSSQGTVTLTSAAPTGGAVVSLSSNSASATVPASVTVAAGATSASFTVTTSAVTTSTTATLTATHNAVSRTATLTIAPAPTGPLPAPSLISPAADARFSPGQNIVFDWSDVTGAASYTIQIDDQDQFPAPQIVNQTVTASTYSSSTLPTTRMWFRVRANDAAGNPGNWSSIRRFEVRN